MGLDSVDDCDLMKVMLATLMLSRKGGNDLLPLGHMNCRMCHVQPTDQQELENSFKGYSCSIVFYGAHLEDKPLQLWPLHEYQDNRPDHGGLSNIHEQAQNSHWSLHVLIILGVAITMSTVFITARHSFDDLPRIHSVHPLHMDPRISYK